MRRLGFLCLSIVLTAAPVVARHGATGCGTSESTPAEVMFLHRQAVRARATHPRLLAATAPAASTNRDIGNVAIIEAGDGVVETITQFDLDQSTLNIVTGQGGNFLSPYYMDQWKAWYEGSTFTLPFSPTAVERAKAHRLLLEPGR
jgi:acyl-homoserine lactone acylase PvdQ